MLKFVDILNMIVTAAVAGTISGIAPDPGYNKAFYTTLALFIVQAFFVLLGMLLLPNVDMVSVGIRR